MRYVYGLLLLGFVLLWSSCRKDFETEPSSGNLVFSKDTVYLDTVFSNIGSSTYRLTVHNRSDQDISIPSITLDRGEGSNYRLNVDGLPGKSFQNIDILAKDSIFVFIETTTNIDDFNANENQFLYTDAISFDTGSNQQKVQLVTLVQDAVFLYPELFDDGTTEELLFGYDEDGNPITERGFFLDNSELNFTNEKPYVIYGLAAVPSGQTLSIDAGARLHFHENSGIVVANDASLHVNGSLSNDPEALENEVIFESDRLEPALSEVPGQWFGLWFTQGSTDNHVNYATIKNANVGILIDANDGSGSESVSLKNTQIYNSSNFGLLARTGFVRGENLVITNSGLSSLNLSFGGNYQFTNCTFANYWNQGFREFPAVLVENYLETADEILAADLTVKLDNCIIYGNENIELIFNKVDAAAFDYEINNTLIRFNDFQDAFADDPLYDFENTEHFTNIRLNEDPVFFNTEKNQLWIDDSSAANGLANPSTATQTDLNGNSRGNNPDAGAYESSVFPEE